MKPTILRLLSVALLALGRSPDAAAAGEITPITPSDIGIPYAWKAVLDDASSVTTLPAHVGAWSWDEDNFPETAKGWTHTSAWVQLELTEPAALTLTLGSLAGVPWPAADDASRVAGTNLFPSFTIYRGWDTDSGTITNADGTTLDQDHTFNNRGNIVWAEDVTYLDHLENHTEHRATRTWVLGAGKYTVSLGGNSPATLAEGRQGYQATFTTQPAPAPAGDGMLAAVAASDIGIPYAWKAVLDDASSVTTLPAHVGAWSWDEDNFPETAKGWTHTSAWVQLELTEPAALTLTLGSLAGVPWPAADDASRVAGTNLFPSFTIYRGWDTDSGTITNADGTTLDQDHTFNNRGNIVWAEDVTYLDHLENHTEHRATRTWVLAAGKYTVSLGGNSPATLAEGRQGYQATFTTQPAPAPAGDGMLAAVAASDIGIPYAWKAVLDDASSVTTLPAHVGAWSWDEDNFPETAKGWTHTSAWVQLELTEPAALTLTLGSLAGVPWPAADDASRVAGTNLFPSFTIYRGWDTDSGTITNADGTTLDQDHTFNNRGNIVWAEDVTYLDHLENHTEHRATRTWVLGAGKYTVSLGGNSPATLAEGRQGYQATLETRPLQQLGSGSATVDFDAAAWDALASAVGPAPVQTLTGFFDQAEVDALTSADLMTHAASMTSYTGQIYRMNGPVVNNREGRTSQPTTFAYDPTNPAGHVGRIGLGGIARFAVLGGAGGTLLYGDYTLQFDAARVPLGGSGWYLQGNIPPVVAVFDLLNVQVVAGGQEFRLSGDLAITFEVANFLYGTPTDVLKDVGNLVFAARTTTASVPVIREVAVKQGQVLVTVTGGIPGAICTLLSALDLVSPAEAWSSVGQETFDAQGGCTIARPLGVGESARFFRVRQP